MAFGALRQSLDGTAAAAIALLISNTAHASTGREWNQPRADAAATSRVDVAPIRVTPDVAWRRRFDRILAGPVVSGSVLYVLVVDRGDTALYALQPADGEVLGRAGSGLVRGVTDYRLAAWHGVAAVLSDGLLVLYELDRGTLKFAAKLPGPWSSEPCIAEGVLFASDGDGAVRAVDLHLGKVEASALLGWGRPSALVPGEPGGGPAPRDAVLVFASGRRDAEGALTLCSAWAEPLAKKAQFLDVECQPFADSPSHVPETFLASALLARVGGTRPGWYVHYPGEPALSGYLADDAPGRREMTAVASAPALLGNDLYGYDADGNLLIYRLGTGYAQQFAAAGHRPDGGWVGDVAIAGDVIVSGNWAADAITRHVLWCLSEIRPARQSIPVGDGLLAVATVENELVVLADPALLADRARARPEAAGRASLGAAPPELPGATPGLVLASGVFLPGAVERLASGDFALAPERGASSVHARADVALADLGSERELLGPESAIHDACWRALEARHRGVLEKLFERFLAVHLIAECRRLLEEGERYGLSAADRAAWAERIAGQRESDSAIADLQLERALREEQDAKRAMALEAQEAADWSAGLGLFAAASDLARRADQIAPVGASDPARALDWVPREFPWRADGDPDQVVKAWMAWAEEILPAAGHFVAADDPLWQRLAGSPWAAGAVALRTRDILLVTRETDPRVVGTCLVRAQETVRTLEELLGATPDGGAPLELRLHRTREDYLAEPRPSGQGPAEWSAGYYSPDEGVSRFYVPRERTSAEPLGRDLAHLLAHELAHQWIHRRWSPGRVPALDAPGHWLVEGIAELAADLAAVEPGSASPPLAVQVTADASAAIELMPLAELLALSSDGFESLENADLGVVQARLELRPIKLDTRGLFYAQSAALVHFLALGPGAEEPLTAAPGASSRRAAVCAWLAAIYEGRATAEPWTALGFADLAQLTAGFMAHVRALGGRPAASQDDK